MNKKDYSYALRLTLAPDFFFEEKLQNAIDFCINSKIDDIMFFILPEEYSVGHATIEQVKPWVDKIKLAKSILAKYNITTSLNPWITLLHEDRGRTLKDNQNFRTMVDTQGNHAMAVVCPLDENWQAYFIELYRYFAKEIEPEILWLEDDFRLHNHGKLKFGGCFCDEHMKLYQNYLGEKISRENFVELIMQNKPKYREAYIQVNRKNMVNLAKKIADALSDYHVRFGLMTSDPSVHMIEGRDNIALFNGLSPERVAADRIHLPSYREYGPIIYAWNFNNISLLSRSLIPEKTLVMPEIENAPHGEYSKSIAFTKFQIESSIPLVEYGITLSIFDFQGNGVRQNSGYDKALSQLKPYLDVSKSLGLEFSSMDGIFVPVDELSAKFTTVDSGSTDMYQLKPSDTWFGAYLAQLGFNIKYSKEKKFYNRIIALSHDYLRNLTTAQIIELFENNFILLEGGAVKTLFDLGLNSVCGMESFEMIVEGNGVCGYEQSITSKNRTGCQLFTGAYINIKYSKNIDARKYTEIFNPVNQFIGDGTVVINSKVCIMPFLTKEMPLGLLNEIKKEIFEEIIFSSMYNKNIICLSGANIIPYFYKYGNSDVMICVNFSLDDAYSVSFKSCNIYKTIKIITKENLTATKLDFSYNQETYFLNINLNSLSTAIFIME